MALHAPITEIAETLENIAARLRSINGEDLPDLFVSVTISVSATVSTQVSRAAVDRLAATLGLGEAVHGTLYASPSLTTVPGCHGWATVYADIDEEQA